MRIGHFTTSFPRYSGDEAGIFIKRLIEAMSLQGHAGNIFVPWDYKESQYDECASFKIRRFRYSLITRGYLAFGAGIMPNIRANPFVLAQAPIMMLQFFRHGLKHYRSLEILHAHWIATALPVTLLGRLTRLPVVVTLHGEDLKLLQKPWLRPILLPALKLAAAIVCVNRSPQSELVRSFSFLLNKIHCIPYGVSIPAIEGKTLEHFKRTRLSFRNDLTALFVGSVVARKGIHVLVDAIGRSPKWTLVVCGRIQDKNYFNELRNQIERLGCRDRIFFEGAVEPEQVPLYMAAATVYLSASTHEGRPNAVLEALASGMPSILSDIPAHREVINSGENGLLFAENNYEDLITALNELEQSPERRQLFSIAAKNTVKDMSWENCASSYIELFHRLLKR